MWDVAGSFEGLGLGHPVQWGRWGNEKGPDAAGAGCYVYMDSQATLGVTTEILGAGSDCDTLPDPGAPHALYGAFMPSIPLHNAAKVRDAVPPPSR